MISKDTTVDDKIEWEKSKKGGLIKDQIGSLKDIAKELSKGDKLVEELNISGHGSSGGVSLSKSNPKNMNFNGEGITNPANKSAVEAIKKQLAKNAIITIYSCGAGKYKESLQKIADTLGVKVKAFTGGLSSGPGSSSDEGKWIIITPKNKEE